MCTLFAVGIMGINYVASRFFPPRFIYCLRYIGIGTIVYIYMYTSATAIEVGEGAKIYEYLRGLRRKLIIRSGAQWSRDSRSFDLIRVIQKFYYTLIDYHFFFFWAIIFSFSIRERTYE